jgi:hypothetical protein
MSRQDGEGNCSNCRQAFGYLLIHNGFSDTAFAYCDACGMTAFFDGWSKRIPAGVELKVHGPIDAKIEARVASCDCGGHFRGDASPRCTRCHERLDPFSCAEFIERNAPGTAKGWRWQRSWRGLYAIVIEGRSVRDPWKREGAV